VRFVEGLTDNGQGRADDLLQVRPARPRELAAVLDLLRGCHLPDAGLAEHAGTLLVAVEGPRVIGSAALELYGGAALLRSVAVDQGRRSEGLGRRLALAALDQARARGVGEVYLLTETAADFFERLGFHRISRDDAAPAVGASVEFRSACPASATCMVLTLARARAAGYSILELLIAMIVFGILVSAAWVQMGPTLNRARVRNAATVVATDLQYAQMLAVRQRRPVAVIVSSSLKSYIIRLRDTSLTFRNRFLGQDTEFMLDSLAANPASVVMYPNGVTASATTFTVGLRGYTRRVRLTRAGQVRLVP
jgi:prepilin-type N-terminal cleavage/methylation domain-containing protein